MLWALCITVGITIITILISYVLTRAMGSGHFMAKAFTVLGVVFLGAVCVLWLLPMVGYHLPLPGWSMGALLISAGATLVFGLLGYLLRRFFSRRIPLEKRSHLVGYEGPDADKIN